jgi:hypothetical protein
MKIYNARVTTLNNEDVSGTELIESHSGFFTTKREAERWMENFKPFSTYSGYLVNGYLKGDTDGISLPKEHKVKYRKEIKVIEVL